MEQKLYDLMDWPGIEEIIYSESSQPDRILGPHLTEQGLLIQSYIPAASGIVVKLKNGKVSYSMEKVDDAGFFAVLIDRKRIPEYTLTVAYSNGAEEELLDPYSFGSIWTQQDFNRFAAGTAYDIYHKMGAHPTTLNGVAGVSFSVWAPAALRVSVVGDFNHWDGRRHQMMKRKNTGIYELFIPGLSVSMIYKYEIKTRKGEPMLKSDPYGNYMELRPGTASMIWDISQYEWTDKEWLGQRQLKSTEQSPMSIYEVHLGSWVRKEMGVTEQGEEICGSEFYNYREIAHRLASYVLEMGYTHVELLPVMEHPLDASWGYQVTGYYAPTSRYGTPGDFQYFINYLHNQGVGVILDWVPAHFPKDLSGLACFDGSCVYEHRDPRQGMHPHWGTLIYNYGRPQVSNFLIANALFWAEIYHIDGIRMDAVASMLYLDYGKRDGEWVANRYGGHENLEAVEFLKHLNSIFKKRKLATLLIAEESTAWPKVTGALNDDGLGFDLKWNMGWMNDFLGYMKHDPVFRSHHYGELTFSMFYAYSERFMLVLSHDEVVHGKGSMAGKMPGESLEDKFANLRIAYGYMTVHPGKKLLFMGQEIGQLDEWNENQSIQWELLQYPLHSQMKEYVKDLNHFYRDHPALFELDHDPNGFEWIDSSTKDETIVAFLRKSKNETLLVICNFAATEHKKFSFKVPGGTYKEIFCSEDSKYGGDGSNNRRAKTVTEKQLLSIDIAPLGLHVYQYTSMEQIKTVRRTKK